MFLLEQLLIVLFFLLPFVINPFLARSRGKNILLIIVLTIIFSWFVTLILAFMPKEERYEING